MLIVAVSSRALFNLEDGHTLFQTEGWAAFDAYMRKNEKKALRPGVAFPLVKKLLSLNTPGARDRVEVMLLSSNTLEAGARVMNSVRHYNLDIERAFFTSGADRFRIAKACKVTLFLSTNPAEVRKALAAGIASASVIPHSRMAEAAAERTSLCIASMVIRSSLMTLRENQSGRRPGRVFRPLNANKRPCRWAPVPSSQYCRRCTTSSKASTAMIPRTLCGWRL